MSFLGNLFGPKEDKDMQALDAGAVAGRELSEQGITDIEQIPWQDVEDMAQERGISEKWEHRHLFGVGVIDGIQGNEWCPTCRDYEPVGHECD